MISTLYIIASSGEVIIEKQFREKFPRSCLEEFWNVNVNTAKNLEDVPAVVQYSRFCFTHILRNGVVFMAVSPKEVPPMFNLEILNLLNITLVNYLKEVTEETLRESFSLVYQLLEEVLDNGYPLTSEQHVLEDLVPPPTLENKVRNMLDAPMKKSKYIDTNAVPWRNPATKYGNNEIFFDMEESLNAIVDAEGGIVRADVSGAIQVNCRLSGMPDIVMRLFNSELFDDISYHKCVRHSKFESERSISFVPPDGRFQLLAYRCKPFHNLQPPFYVSPQVSFSKEGGRLNCMVGLRHGGVELSEKEKEIHKIVVHIPLPPQTDTVAIGSCTHGTYSFNAAKKCVSWKIGHLDSATVSLSGEFSFGQNSTDDIVEGTGEGVTVEFQIPNFAISTVRVDSVNVLNVSFKPFKGVKYLTKAGRFTIRTV